MNKKPKYYDVPRRDRFADILLLQMAGKKKGTQADAYFAANYRSKNRQAAKRGANKLKKHPLVKRKIEKFRNILAREITPELVVKELKKVIVSPDVRAKLGGIQEYNRIEGHHQTKIRLGKLVEDISDLTN